MTKVSDTTQQQQETLMFFSERATDWTDKARGAVPDKVNVIAQRNKYVMQVVGQRTETKTILDVGCGSGELVCELATRGFKVTGIDFSPTLIATAKDVAQQQNLEHADFICDSIFTTTIQPQTYDVIAANGFIEYISFAQRDAFFALAWQALRPGGSLVVSSRNRLFNIFSNNSFTETELHDHTIEALVLEATALTKELSPEAYNSLKAAPFPSADVTQTNTGINVSVRYQYTPVQLWQLLRSVGFGWAAVSPIHIHGMVPVLKDSLPKLHFSVAQELQETALNRLAFLPNASAFMIHVTKPY